jgi:hypothetical protein
MDPGCYKEKATRFVKIQKAQAKEDEVQYLRLSDKESHTPCTDPTATIRRNQWVPAKKGECKDTAQGILMDGDSAGKKPWVCVNDKCKTHHHDRLWNSHKAKTTETPAQKEARELKATEERETENTFRREAAKAILTQPIGLQDTLMSFLVARTGTEEYMYEDQWSQLAEWCQWDDFPASGFSPYLREKLATMSVDQLGRLLVLFEMATEYPEKERYYNLPEEHSGVENFLSRLKLTPPSTAAATAKPTKKGK